MSCSSPSDVKQKIASLANPSTSLQTKKSDVEVLVGMAVKNDDFAKIVKECDGILVLTTLFKNSNDFSLKAKITSLLVYLSLNGHSGAEADNKLMNDINTLSLVNLFLEKDFSIFIQAFNGLKVLGSSPSEKGDSSTSKIGVTLSLNSATLFLENFTALIDPSSKLLSDSQKVDVLVNFTQFVITGVMAQAAADAAKDSSSVLSKNFTSSYEKLVKTLEGCRKGDFSALDNTVERILQLAKDGKLIHVVLQTSDLDILNKWLGGTKKFILLYKAINDGFSAATFHSKCNNKGATVTVITSTDDYVFGGYTPLSWTSYGGYVADNSYQTFIFSLKNPHNRPPEKFSVKDSNAIYDVSSYGPTFGGGFDICCVDNCNSNTNSYLNFGSSYKNTTGLDGRTFFTGKYQFTVKDIEVYQVQ